MNSKSSEYTDLRLNEWARWSTGRINSNLDFPSRTTIGRMMEEGCNRSDSQRIHLERENCLAEEIEKFVIQMTQFNSDAAKALRFSYLLKGPQIYKAKKMQISTAEFRLNVNIAKAWLAGRLFDSSKKYSN